MVENALTQLSKSDTGPVTEMFCSDNMAVYLTNMVLF